MSRKSDLEHHINESYRIITEYEDILQTSSQPEEKTRARRAIKEHWELINRHLKEYISLCKTLGRTIPDDIAEIAVHFQDLIEKVELELNSDVILYTGDLTTSHETNIKKLINGHKRRLQMLKERQAIEGIATDPSIIIQIEDIEATLEKLTRVYPDL